MEESQLLFMTHAPGAIVPPRPRDVTDESFADKILGPFRGGRPQTTAPAAAEDDAGGKSIAARLSENAGRGALQRAREASRRAASARYRPPPLDQTLDGASKHVRSEGAPAARPEVNVAAPVPDAALPPPPSFLAQVPGALVAPLRGFPVLVVQAVLLGLGLLLCELSLGIGGAALLLGLAALVSLRVRGIRDACAGQDRVVWPALPEMLSAVPLFGVALAGALAPAAIAAALAWGPAAYDGGPESVQARAQAALAAATPPGEGAAPAPAIGHGPLRVLEAAVASRVEARPRSTAELARELQRAAIERARALVTLEGATPAGLAARALLVAGLGVFPIGLLAAVRLRSAYAALYPPILVRSVVRVFGPWLLLVVATLGQAILLLAALLLLPAVLRDELGAGPGHLAWTAVVALVATGGTMVLSALQGRLYRTRQLVLGWD